MTAAGSQRLDVVRIRVTLAHSEVDAAALAYDLHVRPSRQHELHLCDRPPRREGMLLIDAGIIGEVRLHRPGLASSTMTLRPCRAGQLDAFWSELRRNTHHEMRVEGDWVADRHCGIS